MTGKPEHKPLIRGMRGVAIRRIEQVSNLRQCCQSFAKLEKRFNEAALGLQNGSVTKASGARGLLQAVYVDDDQFRADFEVFRQSISSKGKKIIRYILCELERQHSGQDLSWSTASATIEHILPDHLDEHWATIFSEDEV